MRNTILYLVSAVAITFAAASLHLLTDVRAAISQEYCTLRLSVHGAGTVTLVIDGEQIVNDQANSFGYPFDFPCQPIQTTFAPDTSLGWKIGRVILNENELAVPDDTGFTTTIVVDSDSDFEVHFIPRTETDLSEVWLVVNAGVYGAGHIDFNPSHRGISADSPSVAMTCIPADGYKMIQWEDAWCGNRCYFSDWISASAEYIVEFNGWVQDWVPQGRFDCETAALDPPGNNGTCDLGIGVTGGGNVYANGQDSQIVNPSGLSFECGSAVLVEAEPFENWILGEIGPPYSDYDDLVDGDSFYTTTEWGASVRFGARDFSGAYWVGASVNPSELATIVRQPDKIGYSYGELLKMTCLPNDGYEFVEWVSYHRYSAAPDYSDRQTLEFVVDGNSYHECRLEPIPRELHTKAIVQPDGAPEYTDNALISVDPDTGGIYDHDALVRITSAIPNVNNQTCNLNWYWYVPDVSPDWHLLNDHNLMIPVIMDHDKWFRAEWICTENEQQLHTEAIVKSDGAPQYTDNALISVSPDTGGTYEHDTLVQITSDAPNVSGQSCALHWYWNVPDVSPDWHLLDNRNQTIPVIMDHDKWFRAEWVCNQNEPTPTPTYTPTATPAEASTPVPTNTPTLTAVPTATLTPTPTATPLDSGKLCALELSTEGNGAIAYGNYGETSNAVVNVPCGEDLQLWAISDDGWSFDHFEIDSGVEHITVPVSPYTMAVQDGDSVTAHFIPGAASIHLPMINR